MKMKFSIFLLFAIVLTGCSSFMERNKPNTILSGGDWKKYSSEHYNYYYRPDSRTVVWIDSIARKQESNLRELNSFFSVNDNQIKIHFFIFPSLWAKIAITSEKAYAHCIPEYDAVYYIDGDTISNVLGKHEVTHLVIRKYLGEPVKGFYKTFMDEGLAMYSGDSLAGFRLYNYYTERLKANDILSPYEYLSNSGLFVTNWKKYNQTAGAFSKYLLDNYGFDKYIRLLLEGNDEDDFEKIYRISIKDLSDKFVSDLKGT